MKSSTRVERLHAWIDTLPPSIRPAVFGALLIVFFMLSRGAWIVAPVGVIYVLWSQAHPLHVLAVAAGVVSLAILGGAMSRLAYGLLGRRLGRSFPGARYITAMLTVAPYFFVLDYAMGLTDGRSLWRAPNTGDWVVVGFMTLFVGSLFGRQWVKADAEKAANAGERAT